MFGVKTKRVFVIGPCEGLQAAWEDQLWEAGQRSKFPLLAWAEPFCNGSNTGSRTQPCQETEEEMEKKKAVLFNFWGVMVSTTPPVVLEKLEKLHNLPG